MMDATRFLASLDRARLDLIACQQQRHASDDPIIARRIDTAHATLSTLIETVEAERRSERPASVARIEHVRAAG
jgi:hypothetical protein